MSWGTHHPHHLQHPTGAWALWAHIPSCVQPRLLAGSDMSTELPKQGLKHFPGKTSSMPCYGCQLCPIQPVFGANFKHQSFSLKAFPGAGSPGQPHCKNTIALGFSCPPWRNQGSWRREGCRSLCPPVNPSNSSCGP